MTFQRRLLLLVLVPLLALAAGCGDDTKTPKAENSQCTYTEGGPTSKEVELPPGDPEKDAPEEVTIATDQGDIKVSLDADKAPAR